MVEAFNMGADALRDILSKDGLTVAMVDEAMHKMETAFADQKEVEDAIAAGIEEANLAQMPSGFEDDALEQELADLEQQEHVVDRQQTKSLPPPSHSESELARLDHILSSLKRSAAPPAQKRVSKAAKPAASLEPAV